MNPTPLIFGPPAQETSKPFGSPVQGGGAPPGLRDSWNVQIPCTAALVPFASLSLGFQDAVKCLVAKGRVNQSSSRSHIKSRQKRQGVRLLVSMQRNASGSCLRNDGNQFLPIQEELAFVHIDHFKGGTGSHSAGIAGLPFNTDLLHFGLVLPSHPDQAAFAACRHSMSLPLSFEMAMLVFRQPVHLKRDISCTDVHMRAYSDARGMC